MPIEDVRLYYLSMPEVEDIADGSQDALLVRIEADGYVGWGECEAAPLVTIASWACPMSHSACKSVKTSILGQCLNGPEDITRITNLARRASHDLLQSDHTLSGIDIALWDLLGHKLDMPVWALLGYPRASPKTPYASQLFGPTPHETFESAKQALADGFGAAKFGWGPFGTGHAAADIDQVAAAREGLGPDAALLIDAGAIWGDDVDAAKQRTARMTEFNVQFLEEPFISEAYTSYRALARSSAVPLAAGEGCHNFHMALNMLDHAAIDYIQIDTGRVGGISVARRIADAATAHQVTYLNHTFTSHLALSASLQPFAGLAKASLCEYPVAPSPLARHLTNEQLTINPDGQVDLPDTPGLGLSINLDTVRHYLLDTEITIGGTPIYRTPEVPPQ